MQASDCLGKSRRSRFCAFRATDFMAPALRMSPYLSRLIDRLLPLAASFSPGPCAIALAGAHAKGVADAQSDLDIYVFTENWVDDAARRALVQQLIPDAAGLRCWSALPSLAGTDFKIGAQEVEMSMHALGPLRDTVARALEGQVERHYETWTPNGYYSDCELADVAQVVVLSDPQGLMTPLVEAISVYPPRLRQRLIADGLRSAGFWIGNFHLETALQRADGFYLQSMMQQIVNDLVHAAFAINEVYFPGDKKIGKQLAKLQRLPEGFVAGLDAALLGHGDTSTAAWRERFATVERLTAGLRSLAQSAG
jgi:hypothetical protein